MKRLVLLVAAALCVFAGAAALRRAAPGSESIPGAQALARRLEALDEDVRLTWFASPPGSFTGEYRHLEPALRELFETLERESGGRVRCSRVDSSASEAAHAAALGLAPFRARTIERDGWREETVWSTLRMVVGARGTALVEGLAPEKLPFLARILDAQLEQLLAPHPPRILLEGPGELGALERELGKLGDPVRGTFDRYGKLVLQPDVLLWIAPRAWKPEQLAALRALLERGTSVVLAVAGESSTLLDEFGLRPERSADVEPVRCKGEDQDFRRLAGQPNGTLLFRAPTSFVPDPARLEELGLDFHVLASGPEQATLAALLEPQDPWRGRLVVLGAATPFEDEFLAAEPFAHRALLEVLVKSLASPERRAFARVAATQPARIAELPPARRAWLRFLVVGALPLLLALPLLARRRMRLPWRALALGAAGLTLLALPRALLPSSWALDATREGAHALPAELVQLARECAPVQATLYASGDAELPAEYRGELRGLRESLGRLLPFSERRIEAADAPAHGLHALRVSSHQDETTIVRTIVASLVLEHADRRETLEFPERSSFDDFAFRLGFALERLRTGKAVHIAAACDRPRLSPAEARLSYESKKLFAPSAGDVYGRARAILAQHDFEIEPIASEKPVPAQPAELFLWLQPRRDIEPLRAELERTLARGGKALVAAQHYVVRPRARAEHGSEPAWWPEPQLCDLERGWPASAGVELVREVFLDELSTSAELDETIDREAGGRRLARTSGANPLLVRAASPLGELVLPFANRIRLAPGIAARTLVSSSARCWSLEWKGGDLSAALFRPEGQELLGPQALAVGTDTFTLIGCSTMFQDAWIEREGCENARFLVQCAARLTLPARVAGLLEHRVVQPVLPWIAPEHRSVLRAGTIAAAPLCLCVCALGWKFARRRRKGAGA